MIIDFIFSMILSIFFVKFVKFRDIHKNKTLKNLFIASIYSVLLFFSISFFELIKTPIIQGYKYNVGFPFKYFGMFWVSGNYFPNHGNNPMNFIKNALIIWLFCLFIIGIFKFVRTDKTETLFQNYNLNLMSNLIKDKKYLIFLETVLEKMQLARISASKQLTRTTMEMYFGIGKIIVEQQKKHGWGKSVVE